MAEPISKLNVTDVLCTQCGLCCDGSLFADVELASAQETAAMELLGLEVEEGDGEARGLLVQPCRALKGTRCTVYEHRPGCCRTFECRLLQNVKRGKVTVEAALETVGEIKAGLKSKVLGLESKVRKIFL